MSRVGGLSTDISAHFARPAGMRLRGWGVVLMVLMIQLLLLSVEFPISGIAAGLGPFNIDHPYHQYQVEFGRQLLKQGHLVGYDPFFGGGSLGGLQVNASARLPVLLSALVSDSVPTLKLYSAYLLACSVLSPVLLAMIGPALRLPLSHCFGVGIAAVSFWWIGAFRWYYSAGMAAFVTASFVAVAFTWIAFDRILLDLKRPTWPYLLVVGLLAGLGLWIHPLFAVVAATLFVGLGVAYSDLIDTRATIVASLCVTVIALIINLPWIMIVGDPGAALRDQPYQKTVGLSYLADALRGVWAGSMGSLLNPLVAAVVVAGIASKAVRGRRDVRALVGTGVGMLVLASFGGASVFIGMMQPNRFMPVAFLLFGLASALVAAETVPRIHATGGWRRWGIWAIGLVVLLVLGREVIREALPGQHGHYGASVELTAPPTIDTWLVDWIRTNTATDARIIFENSLGRVYGGGHAAGYLALQTGREFMGGAYPFQQPSKSFWDGRALGESIDAISDDRLREAINLFNVGWIVAHSDKLAARMLSIPGAQLVARQQGLSLFSIDRPRSYIWRGEGVVLSAAADKVTIEALGSGDLVLLYQWVPTLTAGPGRIVSPIELSPNFPPFVKISGSPGTFSLHLDR